MQPVLQIVEDRLGPRLPEPHPLRGRATAPVLLDGVERGDAPDSLARDGRALGMEDVDELAPDVRQAGDLLHAA